jgi:hypothetical protein
MKKYMRTEPKWNDIEGETEELAEKPVPLTFPPQITHGLTRA